jgi:hypothetical protein
MREAGRLLCASPAGRGSTGALPKVDEEVRINGAPEERRRSVLQPGSTNRSATAEFDVNAEAKEYLVAAL